MSAHLPVPLLAGAIATLFVLLACVAVLANVWVSAGFTALGFCLRGAHRLGIYTPLNGRGTTEGAHERVIRLFTRALRVVSRGIPGQPHRDTRTTIIPLLVVGVPVAILGLLLVWAVPIVLFGYVFATTSGPWSTVFAFLSLFAYFGIASMAWRVTMKIPVVVDTVVG